jgi:hypothetical protein
MNHFHLNVMSLLRDDPSTFYRMYLKHYNKFTTSFDEGFNERTEYTFIHHRRTNENITISVHKEQFQDDKQLSSELIETLYFNPYDDSYISSEEH